MPQRELLEPYFKRLDEFSTLRWVGRVIKSVGHLIESEGPYGSVGEGCGILTAEGKIYAGEIVGFRGRNVLSMPT
jgi:flagellum-specific ATP synthase